jgi:hypothetical protein
MATSTCDETGIDVKSQLNKIISVVTPGRKAEFICPALPSFALLERKYLFARTLAICIIVRPIHEPKEMSNPPKEKYET